MGLDAERSDKCNSNLEGIELGSGSTLVSGPTLVRPYRGLHPGLGLTLVWIPNLVLPSQLVLSMDHTCLEVVSNSGVI